MYYSSCHRWRLPAGARISRALPAAWGERSRQQRVRTPNLPTKIIPILTLLDSNFPGNPHGHENSTPYN